MGVRFDRALLHRGRGWRTSDFFPQFMIDVSAGWESVASKTRRIKAMIEYE